MLHCMLTNEHRHALFTIFSLVITKINLSRKFKQNQENLQKIKVFSDKFLGHVAKWRREQR